MVREVMSLRDQYQLTDDMLQRRLDTLLPSLMKRTGIDMWVVLAREYNEDPVFQTLVPQLVKTASRLSVLVFSLKGDTVERICVSKPYPLLETMYKREWDFPGEKQYDRLKKIIETRKPEKIGVNISSRCAMCDGLTKSIYDDFTREMGEEITGKLVSAEDLSTAWLETRLPEELARYERISRLATDIIDSAYSFETITTGVTTTTDLEWYVMEEINRLGLKAWFTPTMDVQRPGYEGRLSDEIIMPGDIIHCDIGLVYLGLCTDHQRLCYVPKAGETEVPIYLREAMKIGNRFQDIVAENYITGLLGNEILKASLEQAKEEGIDAHLYTHPINNYGHGAGPTIGLFENKDYKAIEGTGDYPLFPNTCYALELNVRVPIKEWGNQILYVFLEETVAYTEERGLYYLSPDRKELKLVK